MKSDVVIIGGGLAGLAAASILEKNNVEFTLLEASDSLGGRVKTSREDEFLFDHGFQVLLTAYPLAKEFFDYPALELRSFVSGAKIWDGKDFHLLYDPLSHPKRVLPSIFSKVGSLKDKLKTLSLRNKLRSFKIDHQEKQSTASFLKNYGFSDQFIDSFFRPFFGGVFLEDGLQTSSQLFLFYYKMFAEGVAAIPARGMGELPKQLFLKLNNKKQVLLNEKVISIKDKTVDTENLQIAAKQIIFAADAEAAHQLLGTDKIDFNATNCLYFSLPKINREESILYLNISKEGKTINNLCFLDQISSEYAPVDRSLLSVTCLGKSRDQTDLVLRCKSEIEKIFPQFDGELTYLKSFEIPNAIPRQEHIPSNKAGFLEHKSLLIAGDWVTQGSINGALASGKKAAEEVISRLKS